MRKLHLRWIPWAALLLVAGLTGCEKKPEQGPQNEARPQENVATPATEAGVEPATEAASTPVPEGHGHGGLPLEEIEKALQSGNPQIRMGAVRALRKKGAVAIPTLKRAAQDQEDPEVRSALVAALGEMGVEAKEAMPTLEKALADDDWHVAAAAATALGKMGADAIPALNEALGDENPEVQAAAVTALGRMGPDANEAVLPVLKETLQDAERDPKVRSAAAVALVRAGAEAIPDLQAALEDENVSIQSAAAGALGQIGPEAVPALQEVLRGENMYAKFSAASVLGNMKAEAKEAIPALEEALKDENPGVRSAAAEALKKIKGEK
ncbi:MAG: HEAT repeat domain-containing protein [Planctomycetota bacterium]